MDDRFNTIAGWTLFGGIVALGLSTLSSHYFQADKHHRPEQMGYAIAGVEAESGGGAAQVLPIANRLASGDMKKGEAIFAKCKACHTVDQGGANGIGPNLYATVGEAIATGKGGFAFSDALKKVGGNWTFEQLDKWLAGPKAFADGTKMTFAGISDPQERADVILYLNSQGSNLPLPAPEAVPAPGAAAEGAAPAAVVGDAAKGEKIFAKCKSCHTIDKGGANGIGPNLYGVAGEAVANSADRGGFAFSDALKAHSSDTWTEANLDKWLTSPKAFADGTKMTFAGLPQAQDRADVIAYLNTQGGKLTLGGAAAPAAEPAKK